MRRIRSRGNAFVYSRGITLIEVAVAGTVLGLAFVGMASMLSKGKEVEYSSYMRQQAYRLAANVMEDTAYDSKRYPGVPVISGTPRDVDLKSPTGTTVVAQIKVYIDAQTSEIFRDPVTAFTPGQPVDYKLVTAKVLWPKSAAQDSIILRKRIVHIP